MVRPGSFSALGFCLLLFGAIASPQARTTTPVATTPPAQNAPVPVFHTTANLVIVDVVVRDHGAPVHDLRASDFRIFEDGRAQKITVFEEHRSSDALRVATAPANLPPHTYSDAPQYILPSAVNILLLDALNTPLPDQIYVRRRMIQYLHTIPPGTRIAVFTLGSRLRIIEGFTTDPSVIEKAITKGRGSPEESPVLDPDWDQTLNEAANLAGTGGASSLAQAGMAAFATESQNFESQLRAGMTFDAMDQLAHYLATIPGRKNLVWFTGSVPFSLVTGSNPDQDQMADLQDQAKKMLELLALARVALYPVDARGLLGTPGGQAETRVQNPNLFNSIQAPSGGNGAIPSQAISVTNPGGGGENSAGSPGQSVSQVVQQRDSAFLTQNAWDHFNMEQFAKATGGKAFVTNGLGQALGDAIANGSDYYTLAYAPENANYNGAYRKIDVKLPEYHYDLQYRRGYFAEDPASQDKLFTGRRSPLIDAMQHGVLPLSQVLFQVRVVGSTDPAVAGERLSPDPAGALVKSLKPPLQRYVADYTIDPSTLNTRTLPDGRIHSEVELTQVAYNVEGIRENYTDVGLGVDTPPAQARDGIHLHQEIDLPAGQMFLKIGVHDLVSGRIGTVEIPLTVPKR